MNLNKKFDKLSVDKDFKRVLDEARRTRVVKEIDMDKRSFPELSRMIMNCPSFSKTLEELKTLPKKEDLKRGLRGLKWK